MGTDFGRKNMTGDKLSNLIDLLRNPWDAPDPRITSLFSDPYSQGTQTTAPGAVNPPQTLTQPSPDSGAPSQGAAMARAASQASYASLLGWPTGDDGQSDGNDPGSGQAAWGAWDYDTPMGMNPTSTNFGQGLDDDGMQGIQMRATVLPASVQAKFGMQPSPSTPANVQAPVNQASNPSQPALPSSNQAYGIDPATGQPWWGAPPDNVPDYFKLMPSSPGTGSDDGMQGIQMRTTTLPPSVQAKFGMTPASGTQTGSAGNTAAAAGAPPPYHGAYGPYPPYNGKYGPFPPANSTRVPAMPAGMDPTGAMDVHGFSSQPSNPLQAPAAWWKIQHPDLTSDPFTTQASVQQELRTVAGIPGPNGVGRFVDTPHGKAYYKVLNDRLYAMQHGMQIPGIPNPATTGTDSTMSQVSGGSGFVDVDIPTKSGGSRSIRLQIPNTSGGVWSKADALADKYGVPRAFVRSIIQAENGGEQYDKSGDVATSSAGALGIMQLMPETARGLGVDPNDPYQNLEGGIRLLGNLYRKYNGDVALAAAAYNAGEGNVHKYGNTVPPFTETQGYVKKVRAMMAGLGASQGNSGATTSLSGNAGGYRSISAKSASNLSGESGNPIAIPNVYDPFNLFSAKQGGGAGSQVGVGDYSFLNLPNISGLFNGHSSPSSTRSAASINSGSIANSSTNVGTENGNGVQDVNVPRSGGAADRIARAQYYVTKAGSIAYHQMFQRNGVDITDPNPIKGKGRPPTVPEYTDCGRFMNEVIGRTDPEFPSSGSGNQHDYVAAETKKGTWESGKMGDGHGPHPGDWLYRPPPHRNSVGHVAIFGGIATDPEHKGQYIIYNSSLEAGKGNGHGPKVEYSQTMPNFTMWGRAKQASR